VEKTGGAALAAGCVIAKKRTYARIAGRGVRSTAPETSACPFRSGEGGGENRASSRAAGVAPTLKYAKTDVEIAQPNSTSGGKESSSLYGNVMDRPTVGPNPEGGMQAFFR